MAADVTLSPADAADVAAVVSDMRDIDRLEAWEIGAATPKVAVARAIRRSEQAFAIRFEGRAAGLFGATQPGELSGIATPWMVGTHALPWALKRSGPALRQAWEEVDRMLARARRLENVVHPGQCPGDPAADVAGLHHRAAAARRLVRAALQPVLARAGGAGCVLTPLPAL